MKALFLALALAAPVAAITQSAPAAPSTDAGFRVALFERYCAKMRESPVAYVQFVNRVKPLYGYTVWDFVPEEPGAPVRFACRVAPERVAALRTMLAQNTR